MTDIVLNRSHHTRCAHCAAGGPGAPEASGQLPLRLPGGRGPGTLVRIPQRGAPHQQGAHRHPAGACCTCTSNLIAKMYALHMHHTERTVILRARAFWFPCSPLRQSSTLCLLCTGGRRATWCTVEQVSNRVQAGSDLFPCRGRGDAAATSGCSCIAVRGVGCPKVRDFGSRVDDLTMCRCAGCAG